IFTIPYSFSQFSRGSIGIAGNNPLAVEVSDNVPALQARLLSRRSWDHINNYELFQLVVFVLFAANGEHGANTRIIALSGGFGDLNLLGFHKSGVWLFEAA